MAAFLLSKPRSPCFPSLSSLKTSNSIHLRLSSKPYSTSFSSVSSKTSKISAALPKALTSRSASYEPQKGADVLLVSLEIAGVDTVFALPGDSSMEIHQALTRSPTIYNVLCRQEQGSILATSKYFFRTF